MRRRQRRLCVASQRVIVFPPTLAIDHAKRCIGRRFAASWGWLRQPALCPQQWRRLIEEIPLSVPQSLWYPPRWRYQSVEQLLFRVVLLFSGPLDVTSLRTALQRSVARHEILRTRYGHRGRAIWQIVEEPFAPSIDLIDLSGEPADLQLRRQQEILRDRRDADIARVYAGEFRPVLFRLNTDEHVLAIPFGHVGFDPSSTSPFIEDLKRLYREAAEGRTGEPVAAQQYRMFARARPARAAPSAIKAQRSALDGRLADFEPLRLSAKGRSRARSSPLAIRRRSDLEFWSRAAEAARDLGLTAPILVLASVGVLLSLWSGQPRVLVGHVVSLRPPGLDQALGCFSSVTPFFLDLAGAPTFAEVLDQAKATYILGRRLIEPAVVPPRLRKYGALVNMIQPPLEELTRSEISPGLFLQTWIIPQGEPGTTSVDLRIDLYRYGSGGLTSVTYAADRIEEARVRWLMDSLSAFVLAAAATPSKPIAALTPPC